MGTKFYAARDRVQPVAGRAKEAASSGWGSAVSTLTPLVAAATENVKNATENVKQSGKQAVKQTSKQSSKESKASATASKKAIKADKKAIDKSAKKLEKRAAKAASRKQKSGKGSTLLGIALLGSAVGAGAAYVMRRRRAAQWDEYDPAEPLTPAGSTAVAGTDDAALQVTDRTEYGTSAGTGYDSSPATPSEEETVLIVEETTVLDDPALSGDTTDQTSSAQHSPKVARMASGNNKE